MEFTIENGCCITTVNGVRGTLGQADVNTIINYAKKLGPDSKYLETGSYLGCSSLIVALNSNATVWAHDIWVTDWSQLKGGPPPKVDDYFFTFYKMVKDNNMIDRIIPIRGDSVYTLGIHDDKSIDLAFIDGDHSYDGCLADLEAVYNKMKEKSVILVHDCTRDSGPLKAVETFCKDKNIQAFYVQNSCGMFILQL
jgi:predicted O-methyltransferase YrrM